MGATKWQQLTDVQLPLAKGTIVLGINQTMMAALSMATIAALIATPGLGQSVIQALETLNVGIALNASIALVAMAIVFDRVTTAASRRTEASERSGQVTGRPHPIDPVWHAVGDHRGGHPAAGNLLDTVEVPDQLGPLGVGHSLYERRGRLRPAALATPSPRGSTAR